jgi:gluconate 2-dehydrogenase
MKICYHNRKASAPELEAAVQNTYLSWTSCSASRTLSCCNPYNAETHHLIGARELALVKSSAI